MPKWLLRLLAVIVVLGLAGGGYWWWSTRPAPTTEPTASGTVDAHQYQVAPTLSARVAELLVAEGARVTRGQPLVRLDTQALDLQVRQAEQGVRAAEAAVAQARDDGTDAEVAEAQARVEQAKASVELAQVQRSYATISAPHDGVVTQVVTNVGAQAVPGRTLVTITDTSDLFARVYVPEPNLGKVGVGSSAQVRADGVPDATGTVTFVSSEAEFTPNSVQTKDQRTTLVYEVRVALGAADGWKPGLPVDVTFP